MSRIGSCARRFSASKASDATSDVSLVVELSAQVGQAHALPVVVANRLAEGFEVARVLELFQGQQVLAWSGFVDRVF